MLQVDVNTREPPPLQAKPGRLQLFLFSVCRATFAPGGAQPGGQQGAALVAEKQKIAAEQAAPSAEDKPASASLRRASEASTRQAADGNLEGVTTTKEKGPEAPPASKLIPTAEPPSRMEGGAGPVRAPRDQEPGVLGPTLSVSRAKDGAETGTRMPHGHPGQGGPLAPGGKVPLAPVQLGTEKACCWRASGIW